jgi:hypothetical protein
MAVWVPSLATSHEKDLVFGFLGRRFALQHAERNQRGHDPINLGFQMADRVRAMREIVREIGEPPRNRTENPQIKSLLLCQLS